VLQRGCDTMQVCQQIAFVLFPVGSAMTAMLRNLIMYLQSAGCCAPSKDRAPGRHVPKCPPVSNPASEVYTGGDLAAAWAADSSPSTPVKFEGRPGEYLTQLLPRVMYDYIAGLVSIGVRIDAVARSHNIRHLKALDIIKHQVRGLGGAGLAWQLWGWILRRWHVCAPVHICSLPVCCILTCQKGL
jgi:hypothetical protein